MYVLHGSPGALEVFGAAFIVVGTVCLSGRVKRVADRLIAWAGLS